MVYFPKMYEIATKNVITVDCKQTIKETISVLKKAHHRSIIVLHDGDYHLFSPKDLVRVKLNNEDMNIKLEDIPLRIVPQIHKDASVINAMELINSGIEYMCIINDDRSLYGLVTNTDIISSIDPETLMENIKIRDYFKKQTPLNFIETTQSIRTAITMINNSELDCVIVQDNGIAKGILTSKDTIFIIANNISLDQKIEGFFSCPIETIPENFTIREALTFINTKHFKRIIATNKDGKICGIIDQKELISYSYSHWASMMKNYHDELLKLNRELQDKSDKLQIMASTDMLTSLYNRHMFTELFNKFLEKKKRDKDDGLVLALLDIDNFKSINDTYGHNIGDEVLINIANLLSSTLRSSDISARWGGEEFVILLTNTNLEKGFTTIEKLREVIATLQHDIVKNITVSIGITEVLNNDILNKSVKRADDALYISKQTGKNKTSVKQ